MRIGTVIGMALGSAALLACSGGDVCISPEFGCADVEPPTVATPTTLPDTGTFETTIHNIFTLNVPTPCGSAGCHDVGGPRDFQMDNAATIGSAEMTANYTSFVEQWTCFGSRNVADVAGAFPDRFLINPPHQGISLLAAQETSITTWAQTGAFPSYADCP